MAAFTTTAQRQFVGYGTGGYSFGPYAGYIPAVIVASEADDSIPFLAGNDRYQVLVCASSGDSATAPQFRYWYAGGAPWGEVIRGDDENPQFYTVDENGAAPAGSVELPFREIKTNQEAQIDGVLVEFTPQPYNLIAGDDTTVDVGFSCRVEGYGPPDYARVTAPTTTGIAASATVTFAEDLSAQADSPWPNTRTVYIPIRLDVKVRAARVILTAVKLCEINRVTLLGKMVPLGHLV